MRDDAGSTPDRLLARTARYATLDHWRGAAALAVVFHHTPLYAYENAAPRRWAEPVVAAYRLGWWGVPAFFAISGFCVVAAAVRSPGLGTYFRRRLRRIYPPYLVAVCICLALWLPLGSIWSSGPYAIARPGSLNWSAWLANLTLTAMWLPRVTGRSVPVFIGPAWTLCYEEAYYLTVGLLLACVGRRALFWGVLATTVAFRAASHLGVEVETTPADPYWYAFAAGATAFVCVSQPRPVLRHLCFACLVAGVLVLTVRAHRNVLALHATSTAGGVIGAIFAVVPCVLHPFDVQLAALRPLAPLRWCGERCYSIYLVHWPVCKLATVLLSRSGWEPLAALWPVVTVPFSLLAGNLFHVAVERRFHGRHRGPTHRPT